MIINDTREQEERLAPVRFVEGLKESRDFLKEAARCLQHNPVGSDEDKLTKLALQAGSKIEEMIAFFGGMFNCL